jgi:hypothetical protein
VLTVCLAIGLGGGFRRFFEQKKEQAENAERSLWNHL